MLTFIDVFRFYWRCNSLVLARNSKRQGIPSKRHSHLSLALFVKYHSLLSDASTNSSPIQLTSIKWPTFARSSTYVHFINFSPKSFILSQDKYTVTLLSWIRSLLLLYGIQSIASISNTVTCFYMEYNQLLLYGIRSTASIWNMATY